MVPGAHREQLPSATSARASLFVYEPAGQSSHSPTPVSFLKVPAGHAPQACAAAGEP